MPFPFAQARIVQVRVQANHFLALLDNCYEEKTLVRRKRVDVIKSAPEELELPEWTLASAGF